MTWKSFISQSEYYLEYDENNSLIYSVHSGVCGQYREKTFCFHKWRLIVSTRTKKGTYEVNKNETTRSQKDRATVCSKKVCSLVERHRKVQRDRLRDASAEHGGFVKSRKA